MASFMVQPFWEAAPCGVLGLMVLRQKIAGDLGRIQVCMISVQEIPQTRTQENQNYNDNNGNFQSRIRT